MLWFIPFKINLAFWIGISIIVFGEVTFIPGFLAMREYPEKKQTVIDWGIYKVSRNCHVLAGIITNLGRDCRGMEPKISHLNLPYWAISFICETLYEVN